MLSDVCAVVLVCSVSDVLFFRGSFCTNMCVRDSVTLDGPEYVC